MSRRSPKASDVPGHDSFLDVVSNMVGILIILVMVVGVRVRNTPVAAATGDGPSRTEKELQQQHAAEESLRDDVLDLAGQIRNVGSEIGARGRQRDLLAMIVAALEHKIQSRRAQMDVESREQFDLGRSLSEAKTRRDRLRQQRARVEAAQAAPVVVESYPTPLSQTVNGREIHFQLRGGRIVRVPVDELLQRLKAEIQRRKRELLRQPELVDTIGPLDGFRLRYKFRRHDITPEMAMETGYHGSIIRLKQATFIPVSDQMGESMEAALAEGSRFRQIISRLHPRRTAITIWTYPESFAAFRRIRKELYRLGFTVAARPLPEGAPISASPQGTKSAAE